MDRAAAETVVAAATGGQVQAGEMEMNIAVLVMTDGRDEYLDQTVRSAMGNLTGPIVEWWMHDDTGSDEYRAGLRRRYPTFLHAGEGPRRGFGGAIRHAWSLVAATSTARFVFHLEADFLFRRPVDLAVLAAVLDARAYLVQMALIRQACNADERDAGGLIERYPQAYTARRDDPHRWLEHRLFYTTNPSLIRRSLVDRGWPEGEHSEGRMGIDLCTNGSPEASGDQVRFGYWGDRVDGPWVDHIGTVRAGTGY